MTPFRSPIAFLVAAFALAQAAAPAAAEERPVGLRTPSGNIHCQFFSYDGQTTLRCDIAQIATRPPRPADCDLEWGNAFEVSVRGSNAQRICYGDTVIDASLPVLAYGGVWQHGGFTCTSEPSGLTCFNADRHGFALSKARQDLF